MDSVNRLLLAAMSCVGVLATCAAGQEVAKLTASDREAEDYFAHSVSLSGDCAIIGAPNDDDLGTDCGSAYVFRTDGITWGQEAKLTALDGAEWDRFGEAVGIDGSYAVAGAVNDDDRGQNSGSAYVFFHDGAAWTQQAKLTASDGAAGDYFGWAVAISADRVIIGAIYDDDSGTSSGAAYIFRRSGASWVQEAKLRASDGATEDFFGWSVSLEGGYAVVGAPGDDDHGNFSGSAYVFCDVGGAWVEQAKLTAADGSENEYFGKSVALSGSRVIVGLPQDSGVGPYSGSAYVYTLSGGAWTQSDKLIPSDTGAGDSFGYAVSLWGDYAMIGASGEHAAYVFAWDGADWIETTKLTDVAGMPEDFFGNSVAIGSDYGIVGAYGDDTNAGAAFVYDGISYLTAAIYRFWSPVNSRHFYTISKAERDKLLYEYASVWMYEDIAYYAFPGQNVLDILPVYRFWSPTLRSHFYTMDEAERDKLINIYSYVWTYEGPVFYAYPAGLQPFDAVPVYRFWSAALGTHFFTSDEAEKDKLITLYPHVWAYEGIAWYAYLP